MITDAAHRGPRGARDGGRRSTAPTARATQVFLAVIVLLTAAGVAWWPWHQAGARVCWAVATATAVLPAVGWVVADLREAEQAQLLVVGSRGRWVRPACR